MKRGIIGLLFAVFTNITQAEWAHRPSSSKMLDINNLKFTNRAECARESKKPSKSFFLLIDSLNVGKVLYRVGDRLGKDENFSVQGVYRYRYTVFSLSRIIATRLLMGDLPLLSQDINGLTESQQRCVQGDCRQINQLIENIWNKKIVTGKTLTFQSQAYTSCYALKKFSPIEGHLHQTKPTINTYEKIARAVHRKDELLTSCEDLFEEDDLKVGIYQIDLRKINEIEWQKNGFAFWNSFKMYLSWAFRNSPEAKALSANFANLFRSMDFEETVLIFPNGCRSIISPECSKDFLNLSSLRMLTQTQGDSELSKLDFFDILPDSPENELSAPQTPIVNSDVLHLGDYDSASDWANNFRQNLVKTRGFYKLKLFKATSLLNIIHSSLNGVFIKKLLNSSVNPKSKLTPIHLQEIYLMCSEFKVALDEQTSFYRQEIVQLLSERHLVSSMQLISPESLKQLHWVLNKVAPEVLEMCDKLNKKEFWNETDRPSTDLFASWYQKAVFNVKKNSFSLRLAAGDPAGPFLSFMNLESEPICETPHHCARRLVEILVELKTFSTFARGLIDLQDGLKSPALLNPMAERLACRTYDPWFKTRKTISEFLNSIISSVLSSVVPVPIYFDLSLKEKKIISFEKALKAGKIYYDPKFNKQKIQTSLIADFGPLLKTPCAVAISNHHTSKLNYLAFEGITLNSCIGNERNTLNVYGPHEMEVDQNRVSGCFSCSINLTGLASSTLSYAPGVRSLIFLVKGVVRLIQNLKDPHDIPRSWEIDPNQVYRSWRRLGSIYSSCKNNFSQGKECMANKCEAKIVSTFERNFKKYVSQVNVFLGGVSKISVDNGKKKYGINTPRFGCSLMNLTKEDFYPLKEGQ